MTTFIDTSVLAAVANDRDPSNARATRILGSIDQAVSTDDVIVETWFVLRARASRHLAMRFWNALRHLPITIEQTISSDLERAFSIATQWPDQNFSIVDCTSFAVMERLGLRQVASFDDDFAIYRTGPDRSIAFDVLR